MMNFLLQLLLLMFVFSNVSVKMSLHRDIQINKIGFYGTFFSWKKHFCCTFSCFIDSVKYLGDMLKKAVFSAIKLVLLSQRPGSAAFMEAH